ncbi:hypothetical protein DFP73DRAFT_600311 [Morchella snyderi]|nr:hypothetical protein DFP73DRAFT_600311 [Morchella snyderi]
MGQGGGITFINGTPHDWKRSAPQAHRMENWNIPKVLPAGQSTTLYIEWPSDALTAHIPEFVHKTFTLSDTPFHFALAARRINDALTFQVILTNLTTENNTPGTTINIGFAHDGDVCFVLSGTEGNFTSTNPPIDWMQRNIGTLGPRPLREIWRAGMSGQGIAEIVQEVNRFTAEYQELVVISVSHSANALRDYQPFTDTEWAECYKHFSKLTHLHALPNSSAAALADLPLSTFIGGGASPNAAVLVLTEAPAHTLEAFPDAGFYTAKQLDMYDCYTNTMSADGMATDQLDKIAKNAKDSLKDMAVEAERALWKRLWAGCERGKMPNVVFVDYLKGGGRDVAALCVAVNNMFGV